MIHTARASAWFGSCEAAINLSHPNELAHLIRLFVDDKSITDAPGSPDTRIFEIHRGAHHTSGRDAHG